MTLAMPPLWPDRIYVTCAVFVCAELVASSLFFHVGRHILHTLKISTSQAWHDLQTRPMTPLLPSQGTQICTLFRSGVSKTGVYSLWSAELGTALSPEEFIKVFVNSLIFQKQSKAL